jgi:hypothetical protein
LAELNGVFGLGQAVKRLLVNHDYFWLRSWRNRSQPKFIVQSYIHGRPANCGVVCWNGRVLAGIGVDVLISEGLTGPATVVRVVENSEMMFAAERIASRLKLSGFFGLDFMIEEGSGAAYLIEMNPRCTPLSHLRLGGKRDMVGALWAQLADQAAPDVEPLTRNDKIAYFPQAAGERNELVRSSFQDIPQGEPDLVEELRNPWVNRTVLFRLLSRIGQLRNKTPKPSAGGGFETYDADEPGRRSVNCDVLNQVPLVDASGRSR